MSRYKCPACESKDIVKILYGEPTYEACLASEHGDLSRFELDSIHSEGGYVCYEILSKINNIDINLYQKIMER